MSKYYNKLLEKKASLTHGAMFQRNVMSPSTGQGSHLHSSSEALALNYQTASTMSQFPQRHTHSFKTKGILPPTLRHIC